MMPPMRITGIISGRIARRPVRVTSRRGARGSGFQPANDARKRTISISIKPSVAAGRTPAMNSAPVEIDVAEPRRISAMLGGTDCASSLRFIGSPIIAMSAALDPEMHDDR